MGEFKPTKDSETLGKFARASRAFDSIKDGAEVIHYLGGPKIKISRPVMEWLESLRSQVKTIIGESKNE